MYRIFIDNGAMGRLILIVQHSSLSKREEPTQQPCGLQCSSYDSFPESCPYSQRISVRLGLFFAQGNLCSLDLADAGQGQISLHVKISNLSVVFTPINANHKQRVKVNLT